MPLATRKLSPFDWQNGRPVHGNRFFIATLCCLVEVKEIEAYLQFNPRVDRALVALKLEVNLGGTAKCAAWGVDGADVSMEIWAADFSQVVVPGASVALGKAMWECGGASTHFYSTAHFPLPAARFDPPGNPALRPQNFRLMFGPARSFACP